MKGYLYILKCNDGSFYTGSTSNIEHRFLQHQSGNGCEFTKRRLPVELVFLEEHERVDDAYYREKQVQGWSKKKKLALIACDYNQIHKLSECNNKSIYIKPLV